MEEKMTTNTFSEIRNTSMSKLIITGAIAGLGGGLVFGMLMGMMGMLPMVGMLIGSDSAIIGFIVHMAISAGLGAIFGLVAVRFLNGWGSAIVAGLVYGVIWWVLGALIMMPLMLGMSDMVLAIGADQWMSLMGHMIYGAITALLFVPLSKRI
jgi:uncharacterized membrane protein YagU involved in acid resistance